MAPSVPLRPLLLRISPLRRDHALRRASEGAHRPEQVKRDCADDDNGILPPSSSTVKAALASRLSSPGRIMVNCTIASRALPPQLRL